MSEHERKTQQTETVAIPGMTNGMAEIGKGLKMPVAERGVHSSERLQEPRTDLYGTFDTERRYDMGCRLDREMNEGVGEIVVALTEDDQKKVIAIGRTPVERDPRRGGQQATQDAGTPGDYLMVIVSGVGTEEAKKTYRYLDEVDIAGVVVTHGQGLSLAPNTERRRQVVVGGTVEQAVGLLDSSKR